MTGKTLNWHFTTACNFDCRYCFIAPCRSLGLAEYALTFADVDAEKYNFRYIA